MYIYIKRVDIYIYIKSYIKNDLKLMDLTNSLLHISCGKDHIGYENFI